jgi:hypothetical protein
VIHEISPFLGLFRLMKHMHSGNRKHPGTGHHGVIFLFTDNGCKNLQMEENLKKMREEFEMSIFIILAPHYKGDLDSR